MTSPGTTFELSQPADPAERRRALFPEATDAQWGDWRWQMRNAVHDAAGLAKLVPLTDDELADMELTPTEVLGNRRQSLVPILRADEWIYCTEGLERGEAVWGRRLAGIDALLGEPISSWPEISLAEPSNLGEARKAV